ncbi:MAG: T9SS type A sorting domain-containing protein [Bacteroidales bacterium]|nr:T9SS type A sorting domain-containing protein [Bacteroidales bacterium]MCF6341224.1 T9SS type A sorting domain-containing protein [Bacteroidales bacterium]
MKKTLLSFAAILLAVFSLNAQDLTLSWDGVPLGDTIVTWGEPGNAEIVSHVVVHNNTSNGINMLVRRKRISMVEGSSSAFCWGLCFPPDTEESPEPRLILPGGQSTDEEFSGHYYPNGKIGTSVVEYMFFNKDNEGQNVKIVVKYWGSPAGIAEDAMVGGSISDIYPNPATNMVNIDYELTPEVDFAKIRIVNLLGAVVKEAVVERNNTKLTMDISDLNGGIYFYSVLVNGDVYKTKKLVIQK